MLNDTSIALSQVRKVKSEAKVSMRTEITAAVLTGPADAVARVMQAADDLCGAGRITTLTQVVGGETLAVDATLAEVPSTA